MGGTLNLRACSAVETLCAKRAIHAALGERFILLLLPSRTDSTNQTRFPRSTSSQQIKSQRKNEWLRDVELCVCERMPYIYIYIQLSQQKPRTIARRPSPPPARHAWPVPSSASSLLDPSFVRASGVTKHFARELAQLHSAGSMHFLSRGREA